MKFNDIEETVAFIYKPLACHSYNIIKEANKTVRVATIDTMLSFYFAFFYSDRDYYDENRILCMAQYLFDVQQKNRLQQKGLLKRFSINCYGKQDTLEELRTTKAEKYKELKGQRGTKEFESWFLRYVPFEEKMKKEERNGDKKKNETSGKKHNTKKYKTKTSYNKSKKGKKSKRNKTKKGIFGIF